VEICATVPSSNSSNKEPATAYLRMPLLWHADFRA